MTTKSETSLDGLMLLVDHPCLEWGLPDQRHEYGVSGWCYDR